MYGLIGLTHPGLELDERGGRCRDNRRVVNENRLWKPIMDIVDRDGYMVG